MAFFDWAMASSRPLSDRELQEEIDNMSDMNDSDFDSDDSIADETFTCNSGSESDDSSDSNGSSPVASDEDIANNIPNPNNLDTIPWSSTVKMLQRHQFTGKSGLLKNIIRFDGSDGNVRPVDIFLSFINNEVLELMVQETNRYAQQFLNNRQLRRSSRLRRWKNTDISEMKRFALLLKCWHFVDNNLHRDNESRTYKVQPLIDMVLSNIRQTYCAGEIVVIDETMIPFRGRLKFRQYNPSKSSKYGVKIYKLCTTKGFTYSFSIYCGDDPKIPELDQPGSVVVNLAEGLLNEGRLIITDNFYTSIPLAKYLLGRPTDLCGTLRKNRKGVPKEVVKTNLKKGDIIARQRDNITVLKWHDKRDVCMLSTCHGNDIADTGRKNKEGVSVTKPKVILDYNSGKQGIDVSDQLSSYYSPVQEIIEYLLEVAKTTTQTEASTGEHFMSKILRKDDGKIIRKRCHECYRKNQSEHGTLFATKKTKQVDTYCSICNKPFCLSCFAVTHKNKNQN
ncbi:unnamed protein product [Acanthoscelides obtectus]|uniref:PiggyBac transposable element-derived protein domain-containing protein n=1 Tax=Acanthoscelides obtectus TaxID=200917 RepID=A0A9P0JJV8_ACAOB|nr:unnamed protein product [Acanthoscelides obtectus]CAK1654292.1 PiggyBac transposable element-derived protein 4 [Acanthoscelides obtectus]